MSGRFLNTLGRATLSVAICDRCKTKVPYDELRPDGNSNGLRVCGNCRDNIDPYRLPSVRNEKITLRYPRPDEDIET